MPRALFQKNESNCETFQMKISSACSFIFMQINNGRAKPRFETEAQGNWEIAYYCVRTRGGEKGAGQKTPELTSHPV